MFDKIKKYYDKGLYNKNHIIAFVKTGTVSYDEYELIVGEPLPEDFDPQIQPSEIEVLQNDTRTLKAQVQALSESNYFLEECIVEMAEIIYA